MPHLTIRELPRFTRPREKLIDQGLSQLSTAELIALLLGSGTKTENALTLAKKISRRFCSLAELEHADLDQLTNLKGVGPARAGQIMACFELGRRAHFTQINKQLLSPQDVLPIVDDIRFERREHLIALYLNARHELLAKRIIAIGSLNQAIIEPRDILGEALKLPCSALILIHNHPSGDDQPSDEDIRLTQRVMAACDLLGIELIDHLVVAAQKYQSMKELRIL